MQMDLEVKENELLLIYNSDIVREREALAYVQSLNMFKVKELDTQNDTITELQLEALAEKLGVRAHELVDQNSKAYKDNYKDTMLSPPVMLSVLKQNLDMLRTPVAVYPDRAEFVDSSYKFIKEGMNTYGKSSE